MVTFANLGSVRLPYHTTWGHEPKLKPNRPTGRNLSET